MERDVTRAQSSGSLVGARTSEDAPLGLWWELFHHAWSYGQDHSQSEMLQEEAEWFGAEYPGFSHPFTFQSSTSTLHWTNLPGSQSEREPGKCTFLTERKSGEGRKIDLSQTSICWHTEVFWSESQTSIILPINTALENFKVCSKIKTYIKQ